MVSYIMVYIFSILISSISQVMLKKATFKEYDSKLKEYLNPLVMGAYFMFFVATLITIVALKYVPLSLAPILESLSYIFICILGCIFLEEKIDKKKLKGMSIIILGILVFSIKF